MTDIRIVQHGSPFEAVTMDWLLTPLGGLDTSQELATAAMVALCTDRLADKDDVLPDPDDDDRRGWWADFEASEIWGAGAIGSRLWLMAREKITDASYKRGSTIARAEDYTREALKPFLDQRAASRLDVRAARSGLDRIEVTATLFRGPSAAVELRFASLWDGIRET